MRLVIDPFSLPTNLLENRYPYSLNGTACEANLTIYKIDFLF